MKVKDTFQYVPLLDSLKVCFGIICTCYVSCLKLHVLFWKNNLQALVRKPEIRDEIEGGHCASAGVLHDFCDGEFLRNHPLDGRQVCT